MSILESLAGGHPVAAGIVATLTLLLGYHWVVSVHFPASLPRVREKPGARAFSWRTRLDYYVDCKSLFFEAYEKYSKRGKTVAVPGVGARTEVVLPNTAAKWINSQPDGVLSAKQAFVEIDQVWWAFGTVLPSLDPWQGMLIKSHLNGVLEDLMAGVNDELNHLFDVYFGTDTESWREVDLMDVMKKIVCQASSRFTVGLSLCRNEAYLKVSRDLVDTLFINAGSLFGMPSVLRPLFAIPLALVIRYQTRKLKKLVAPLYRERLAMIENDPEGKGSRLEPLDHFQMMLRFAQKERPQELKDLNLLMRRLAIANFGSMHQTTIAAANLVLNIIDSDREHDTIAQLRDEAASVLGTDNGTFDSRAWTKSSISRMRKSDSISRETFRLQSFGNRALMRTVMVDGLRTEDGIDLPKGSMISVFSGPSMVDGSQNSDETKLDEFDPFRFSRKREEMESVGADGGGSLSMVATSPQYLPFGHGKNACPGRFLLDFELKMIVAYLVTRYDVKFPNKYGGRRPEARWVVEALMPPSSAKIWVRRRASC